MTESTDDLLFPAEEELEGAQWLTTPDEAPPAGERPGYEFRHTFSLVKAPERAVLTATAHGVYEAFINGSRVGDIELAPGATSYRRTLYVQAYDVTKLLTPGLNELRIVVSDGWFRGRCGPSRVPDNFGTQIGILASLKCEESGRKTRICTGHGWQVARGAIVSADLMDGQFTDLRRIGKEEWEPAILSTDVLTNNRSRLGWSPAPPVRVKEQYRPRSIHRLPNGRQIIDFGQILNGRTRLSQLGPAGTRVELTHGEILNAEGDLVLDHLAYNPPWQPPIGVGQKDIVISRGLEGDIFEPRHTTHGFRYVAVDGLDQELLPDNITAVQLRTDFPSTGSFTSSDDSLNALHRISVASWHANSCDLPTDCPQRERWGYTGDFQIFARSAAFLDDIDGFARKWLRSLADDQFESGLIPNVAPLCGVVEDPHVPFSLDGAAGWGDAATVVPWELYRQYGDVQILRDFYPMMSRWVDYAAGMAASQRHPERVLKQPEPAKHEAFIWDSGWQWGEWLEPDTEFDYQSDKSIVATAYLALSARIVADSAQVLGVSADEARYRSLEKNVVAAWQEEFVRTDATITEPTQANYVRGLAFGLFPQTQRAAAARHLVNLIEENGNRLSTGFLSTGLLLPTLSEQGHTGLAYKLLFQREEPGWLLMLDRGATTVWEAWNGVDNKGEAHGSLNHYSKGAVVTFLHEYVAGIRPAAPGYAAVEIAPHPWIPLTHASATVETRNGEVRSSWKVQDGRFILDIATAHGVPTSVVMPDGTRHVSNGGAQRFVMEYVETSPGVHIGFSPGR
ncbi:family 78 glycoside hydrolase catalytic domain [Paenarthrobacter nicotinovorans]|uniref:family 78 glycoside hydrolase catalytic domain n=1 Tax=Paenarthrobacter nicotinovorans TaxID=29320 RepID=UPI003748B68A